MVLVLLGGVSIAAFSSTSNVAVVAVVAISCFVIGLGIGLVATPSVIAAQS